MKAIGRYISVLQRLNLAFGHLPMKIFFSVPQVRRYWFTSVLSCMIHSVKKSINIPCYLEAGKGLPKELIFILKNSLPKAPASLIQKLPVTFYND